MFYHFVVSLHAVKGYKAVLKSRMDKGRIAYIDAMRGLTMILVVYSHVCGFCLGDRQMAFNDVLFLFRLPCFFFISGWLFYGVGRQWTRGEAVSVVRKKFMVQIVPTLVFLFLLSPPPAFFTKFGAFKGGYWFTFALFVFFLLYMLSVWPFRRCQGVRADVVMLLTALAVSATAYWYDVNYRRLSALLTWQKEFLGFLSFVVWRYYLFFFLGTLARKYFLAFLRLTGHWQVLAAVVLGFVAVALVPQSDCYVREYVRFSVGGGLGMVAVFTLFRGLYAVPRCSSLVPHLSWLEFIGRRTLDIYLLHYFFLPEFLLPHASRIVVAVPQPWLIPLILAVAFVVVALCLAASHVIRLSPFLAHYLFGAKR